MIETEQKACPKCGCEPMSPAPAGFPFAWECDSFQQPCGSFFQSHECLRKVNAVQAASLAEKDEQLAATRKFIYDLPDKIRTSGEPGPGGINITSGIPAEIYVAIGRDRYDDEYDVAKETADAVRESIADCIPIWLAAALQTKDAQ